MLVYASLHQAQPIPRHIVASVTGVNWLASLRCVLVAFQSVTSVIFKFLQHINQSINIIYKALFTSADVKVLYRYTNGKQCRCRSMVARKNSLENQEPPSCWKRHCSSPDCSWMVGRSCSLRMCWYHSLFMAVFLGKIMSEPIPLAEKQPHT
jgi:hypothetical protein